VLKYVTEEDLKKYFEFCADVARPLVQAPPPILWHYTTGDGLIGILTTKTIFATQVSCMNDQSEFRYANERYRKALAEHPRDALSADGQWALETLIDIETAAAGDAAAYRDRWFVTSFSASPDDLSQWRAYGGGENGYAIGFRSDMISAGCIAHRSALFKVSYDVDQHRTIAARIVRGTLDFFLDRAGEAGRPNS
jgi:hypothetical protein